MQISAIISGAIDPKTFTIQDPNYGLIKIFEFDVARLGLKLGDGKALTGEAFLYQGKGFEGFGGYMYMGMCSVAS